MIRDKQILGVIGIKENPCVSMQQQTLYLAAFDDVCSPSVENLIDVTRVELHVDVVATLVVIDSAQITL